MARSTQSFCKFKAKFGKTTQCLVGPMKRCAGVRQCCLHNFLNNFCKILTNKHFSTKVSEPLDIIQVTLPSNMYFSCQRLIMSNDCQQITRQIKTVCQSQHSLQTELKQNGFDLLTLCVDLAKLNFYMAKPNFYMAKLNFYMAKRNFYMTKRSVYIAKTYHFIQYKNIRKLGGLI